MTEQKTEGTTRLQTNNLLSVHPEGVIKTPTVSVIMPAYNAR